MLKMEGEHVSADCAVLGQSQQLCLMVLSQCRCYKALPSTGLNNGRVGTRFKVKIMNLIRSFSNKQESPLFILGHLDLVNGCLPWCVFLLYFTTSRLYNLSSDFFSSCEGRLVHAADQLCMCVGILRSHLAQLI